MTRFTTFYCEGKKYKINKLAIEAKVQQILEKELLEEVKKLLVVLLMQGIYEFEKDLTRILNNVYSCIAQVILQAAANAKKEYIITICKAEGLSNLDNREINIRISNGNKVSIVSMYAKRVRDGYDGNRYVLLDEWSIIRKSSPLYYSKVVAHTAIRRVINLRFKNASSFWNKHNVEPLYFLRGIFVAFRWNIFMKNLTNKGF